jgi:hypothetical protein
MSLSDLVLEIIVDTYLTELNESDLKRFMPILNGDVKTKKALLKRLGAK